MSVKCHPEVTAPDYAGGTRNDLHHQVEALIGGLISALAKVTIEQLADRFLPGIRQGKILRAWAGVRPLYDLATQASSVEGAHVDNRKATRTFDVLDHAERDGVEGIVSIVGGKLTRFRLMAERTADAVCSRLGVVRPCATASTEIASAPTRNARGGSPDEVGGIVGDPRGLPSAVTAGKPGEPDPREGTSGVTSIATRSVNESTTHREITRRRRA